MKTKLIIYALAAALTVVNGTRAQRCYRSGPFMFSVRYR